MGSGSERSHNAALSTNATTATRAGEKKRLRTGRAVYRALGLGAGGSPECGEPGFARLA
jgi:hypothetical protein